MKKIIALLLAFVMVLGLAACGGGNNEETQGTVNQNDPVTDQTAPTDDTEPVEDPYSFAFTQYGSGKIQIVGAEFTQSDYGDDLLRIYFDYTNQDGPGIYHYLSNELEFFSITQDGKDCERYSAYSSNDFIVPEDLNFETNLQPGCTNRYTMLIECDPNGGPVKLSCYLTVGNLIYDPNEVEPFEFEIDTENLMGAPEPFVLPAITDPQYTAGLSASGVLDYPMDSEVSIDGIELTKDYDGKDVLRVKLTVTNNGDEPLTPALLCYMTLYQDGVSLPEVVTWDLYDEDVTAEDEAFQEDLYPGETVQCSALFHPRNQSPVEAVCENLTQSDLRLGACFDVKALYDAAAAADQAAADAAAAAEAAARKALVGTWLQRDSSWDDTYVFNADGTGKLISGPEYPFTYSVSGDTLTLIYGPDDEEEFAFSADGDVLTLTDMWGEALLLDKQADMAGEETEETVPEETEETVPEETEAPELAELLIGTWVSEYDGETYSFNADGTGYQIYQGVTYTYTYALDGDYIDISYDDGDSDYCKIEIVDDILYLADVWSYVRQ